MERCRSSLRRVLRNNVRGRNVVYVAWWSRWGFVFPKGQERSIRSVVELVGFCFSFANSVEIAVSKYAGTQTKHFCRLYYVDSGF